MIVKKEQGIPDTLVCLLNSNPVNNTSGKRYGAGRLGKCLKILSDKYLLDETMITSWCCIRVVANSGTGLVFTANFAASLCYRQQTSCEIGIALIRAEVLPVLLGRFVCLGWA